jgi:CarD family transcriptional regulator
MAQKKPAAAKARKKAPAKKSPSRGGARATAKAPVKRSAAKKAVKAPAKKAAAKKSTAVKSAAKKGAVKKAPTKKTPAKQVAVRKAAAKAPAKKAAKAAKKAMPAPPKSVAKKAPSEETKPAQAKKAPVTSKYSVGDKVVHPQHGAATIAKRVKQTFDGQSREYYVLDISTESLTVMIPVDKVDSVVRSVISKTASKNVLASLKGEPQEAGANWSRWYKVLTEKMYSGDIFQVAEVVRDLSFSQQTKGISPALKRMLSKARMTLISELSFSLEVNEEEATNRLDRALPKVEGALVPID